MGKFLTGSFDDKQKLPHQKLTNCNDHGNNEPIIPEKSSFNI